VGGESDRCYGFPYRGWFRYTLSLMGINELLSLYTDEFPSYYYG